jgi:hypothetical protein
MEMSTSTRTAYAVQTADWLGEPTLETREVEGGSAQATRGGRTFQAEHVKVARAPERTFTPTEREWIEREGAVVPHRTFSLQQDNFRQAGFETGPPRADSRTFAEVLGVDLVIAIACSDNYGIFPTTTVIRRYATVADWRASADYPKEDA